MILTVGNTKGGVGKTTLALNLAIVRALAGREVWFVDGDRQGTGQMALMVRAESAVKPFIACAQYGEGLVLRQQVREIGAKFEDVVIDVGGRDSTALRAALAVTEVLVTPLAPRSLDVWALADMAALVEEARGIRGWFPAFAVLNQADATGSDNQEALAALADYPQFQVLASPIRRRKAFATSAGRGLSVLELVPRDLKAVEEVQSLVRDVFT